jgi:predicted phage terminase large subunit-like protein
VLWVVDMTGTSLGTEPVAGSDSLPPEVLANLREEAKSDLYLFAKGILGYDRLVPHIHMPICRMLEEYETRTRFKLCLPRGWYKSTLCSIAYPLWRAVKNPNIRILLAQNTFANAASKLGAISNHVLGNDLFKALFPEVLPDKNCIWTKEKMCLKRTVHSPEGTFEAAGTSTQVVSRHYDLIIEDDTVAPDLSDIGEENIAPTKDDISQAIGWHRLVPPLLTSIAKDQILVVGTRWFEKDLLSWIAENEPYYSSYTRACRERDGIPDETAEASFPEQFPNEVLRQLEVAMGPYMFSCLYMNKPVRSGDMTFHLDWFQYYDMVPSERDLVYYTTLDPAGDPEDTKGEPDYNVVATCAKSLVTGKVFLVDLFREKCNPDEVLDALFTHFRLYKPIKAGIESVAYQKSLLYYIRERMKAERCYTWVEGITHGRKSKNQRILGLQPILKSGNLLIRRCHQVFVQEALSFPIGKNDDTLDAVSMQLEMWALTNSRRELKQQAAQDPFSIDAAIDEIKNKNKEKNLVLDVARKFDQPTNSNYVSKLREVPV